MAFLETFRNIPEYFGKYRCLPKKTSVPATVTSAEYLEYCCREKKFQLFQIFQSVLVVLFQNIRLLRPGKSPRGRGVVDVVDFDIWEAGKQARGEPGVAKGATTSKSPPPHRTYLPTNLLPRHPGGGVSRTLDCGRGDERGPLSNTMALIPPAEGWIWLLVSMAPTTSSSLCLGIIIISLILVQDFWEGGSHGPWPLGADWANEAAAIQVLEHHSSQFQ